MSPAFCRRTSPLTCFPVTLWRLRESPCGGGGHLGSAYGLCRHECEAGSGRHPLRLTYENGEQVGSPGGEAGSVQHLQERQF